jgi:hypothetical protein
MVIGKREDYNEILLRFDFIKREFRNGFERDKIRNFALPVYKRKAVCLSLLKKRDSCVRKLKFPFVFRNSSENKTNYLNHPKSALFELS